MALRELAADGTGATVLFTGRVRPYEGRSRIDSLFYEHYPGMAEKVIRGILVEYARKYRLRDAVLIHRVGNVKAGELSVIVAVSSERRKEGFQACAGIIREVKEKAPIWKREQGEMSRWQSERVAGKKQKQK